MKNENNFPSVYTTIKQNICCVISKQSTCNAHSKNDKIGQKRSNIFIGKSAFSFYVFTNIIWGQLAVQYRRALGNVLLHCFPNTKGTQQVHTHHILTPHMKQKQKRHFYWDYE